MPRSGPDIKTLCSVPGLRSWSANYNKGQRIKSNIQHVTYKSRKKLLRQLHPPPECLIAQVLSLLSTKRASQACLKRCASAHTLSFSTPFKIPVFSNHIHALKTLNISQFHYNFTCTSMEWPTPIVHSLVLTLLANRSEYWAGDNEYTTSELCAALQFQYEIQGYLRIAAINKLRRN